MEKRRPSYDLSAIKRVLHSPETLTITNTALDSAIELGFRIPDVVAVIQGIESRMFYKSMTTIHDPRVWQDVYHVPARGLFLYVKFQDDRVSEFRVISFKER